LYSYVVKTMPAEPIKRIKEIAEPIVEQEDMFLVDVEIKHANKMEVWVLVDSLTGGVNVDSCSKISRELGFLLEEKSIIDSAYRLNVSSPGLSRPLSDKRQYGKNKGRTAKVKYKENDDYYSVEGVIGEVDEQKFILITDNDESKHIPFSDVIETKIVPKI